MPQPATAPNPPAAAGPDPSPQALLRMAVGPEGLAVAIDEVREILEVGRLTALPRTPAFVRGVMNLRGAVVPVIDLAARLGLASTVLGRRSCVVVVEAGAPAHDGGDGGGADPAGAAAGAGPGAEDDGPLVIGLLVDAVYEVFDVPAAGIEPVPVLGTRIAPGFLQGMTRARGEVVGVLALDRVLARHELGALIAAHLPH